MAHDFTSSTVGSVEQLADGSLRRLTGTSPSIYEIVAGRLGPGINIQVFETTGGTYTPTAGLREAIIECVGSGGGGGASDGNSSGYWNGGGGGSGAYSLTKATAAEIGASLTITVPAGGAGGLTTPAHGSPGGETSAGTLCVAKGGSGGEYGAVGNVPEGGAGGVDSTGTGGIKCPGEPGGFGLYGAGASVSGSGNGGSSRFGGGAKVVYANQTGATAIGYGGGGAGAFSTNATATNYAGGAGAPGLCIITEFIGDSVSTTDFFSTLAELTSPDPDADYVMVNDATDGLNKKTLVSAFSPLVRGTALTLSSSAAFTGIPSWVRRITIVVEDLSSSGAIPWGVQIGDSGGLETTGYVAASALTYSSTYFSTSTAQFVVWANAGTNFHHVIMFLYNPSGNLWVQSHCGLVDITGNAAIHGGGSKTLTGTLDRLSLIPSTAFDGGTANIFWE